ncbi:MAG: hypothetical protein ACRDQ7_18045 [Haloechinothrix sp.]
MRGTYVRIPPAGEPMICQAFRHDVVCRGREKSNACVQGKEITPLVTENLPEG